MLSRAVILIIFIPLLVWIFLTDNIMFLVLTEIIIGMSVSEFYKMLKDKGFEVASRIGLFLSLLLPFLVYLKDRTLFSYNFLGFKGDIVVRFEIGGFVVFALMLIAARQILKVKIKGAMAEISYTLFGVIYISYFFSYILLIKNDFSNGNIIVLMTFILIWTCDISAYLVGISIGGRFIKKRLAPEISPKKSFEGAIGGILGTFLVAINFHYIFNFFTSKVCTSFLFFGQCRFDSNFFNFTKVEALMLSIIIALFAELGDLVESKIKREIEIKDSGNLLLGHGGFLDRFDSAFFVLPVVYYFVKFFLY